jgi:hypothetical protein
MLVRVLIAGVVGGILVFIMGAVEHAALGLQSRTMLRVPDEQTFIEHLKSRNLKPGLYDFPAMPANVKEKDQAKLYDEINARYKAGPAGLLLIAPTGEDMMGAKTLGLEWASNTIAAMLVAWIVSLMGADTGFLRRWLSVVAIGVVGWLSLTASYGIWYRFPHAFCHDELYCVLLEWVVAGLAIAAIVRRPPALVATK